MLNCIAILPLTVYTCKLDLNSGLCAVGCSSHEHRIRVLRRCSSYIWEAEKVSLRPVWITQLRLLYISVSEQTLQVTASR